MEWNKHVARRERIKVNEKMHSIAVQEREILTLMTETTAAESSRKGGEWNTNKCSFVFLLSA